MTKVAQHSSKEKEGQCQASNAAPSHNPSNVHGSDDGLHGHPMSPAPPPDGGSSDVGVVIGDKRPASAPPTIPYPESYDGDAYAGDGEA